MPQTLEDGENFGRGDTAFTSCFKPKSATAAANGDGHGHGIGNASKRYAHDVDVEADKAAIKPLTYNGAA